ncbi:hypothetical protein BC943DRAFT_357861 [Umbelopsis sp. AD052]|nr:hypothetical protein BC943DRAFT_357861 [Umbelopsis sp. AD052]
MNDTKQHVFVERRAVLNLAHSCGLGIVAEEEWLEGYQLYVVEQWICDRNVTSNAIKVFTGDPSHRIKVCVIAITSADLQNPNAELRSHLEIFRNDSSLKPKSTRLGEIMLTDPSEYDMDMVLIPDGDYEACIKQVYVNINLRKCNCTGRSALNLNHANQASQDKFRSLYRISDVVPFDDAVINLVTVAQTALFLFHLLKKEYIDGLLCNETMKAFGNFYREYHPAEIQEIREAWMEPHLLTALITKLIMCRQKLYNLGFTTVKDPFTDHETFSYNIGNFQRSKGLIRTGAIDLPTLEKLDQYTLGPLKVRKAIKSKLDDISGMGNSPLVSESSDPEIFSRHATIDSLRVIWRPRLKGSNNYDVDFPVDWIQGSKSLLRGVSARTTKTSEVAAGMISKVAGSFTRMAAHDPRNRFERHNSNKNTWYNYSMNDNIGWAPGLPSEERTRRGSGKSRTYHPSGTSSREVLQKFPTSSDVSISPQGSPSTPLEDKSRLRSPPQSPRIGFENDDSASDSDRDSARPSLELLDKDLPSVVNKKLSRVGTETSNISSKVIGLKAADDDSPMTANEEFHDAVPHQAETPAVKVTATESRPRMLRSVSDSMLPMAVSSQPMDDSLHNEVDEGHAIVFSDTDDVDAYDKKHSLLFQRAHSFTSVPMLTQIPRKYATMDVKTYILYDKLLDQQAELTAAVTELEHTSEIYQEQARRLKATWLHRKQMYEETEAAANEILEEQAQMESTVKGLEDGSAKLLYEMNVINDKLRDVEENVTNFYSKVELLETKMHKSQRSATTMLIVSNYFNHYIDKFKNSIFGPPASTPFASEDR